MGEYANDVLVSTDWLAENIDNPDVRIVEVDEDTEAYERGHIRNALGVNWKSDLLPISLAACTAYDIVNILHKQRQDLKELEASMESVQDAEPPWRFRKIAVKYIARGNVDPGKAKKALALSEEKYCSISATLRPVVDLTFEIEVEAEGASAEE